MNAGTRRLGLLALVASIIGCDRVTKQLAASTLAGVPGRSYLADMIRLEYAENPGGFLSLGAHLSPLLRTGLFTLVAGVILCATIIAALRLRWTGRPLIGLCLVFAGGASNLADRIAQGRAVDFMNVGLGTLRTGIFNVADVAIMAGVAILLATWQAGRVWPSSASTEPHVGA